MLQVPADPFRALIAHCLGSSRPLLNARSSHAPESDVKDAKKDSEVDISLPSDLLELIVQHLPRSDHAAARLTCRDMEKLIAPMLRMLFIKDWDISISTESATAAKPGVSCKWAHVQHLDLLTEPQWPLLQAAISRLPNLTHLRINTHLDERLPASFIASGALAGLTRLDLGRADAVLPPGMQLPKLLALRFGGCYVTVLESE